MKTSIAISVSAIVGNLLAETALRHHLSPDRPPLLTRDQTAALRRLAASETAAIAAAVGASVNPPDDDSDIIALEVAVPASASPATLRALVEKTIGARITATAYAGTDSRTAAASRATATESLGAMRALLSAPAAISPTRF